MSVKPVIENNKLSFVMFGVKEPSTIQIYSIDLIRKGECQSDCMMWSVMNEQLEDGTFTYIKRTTLTIDYGEELTGMIVKQKNKELVIGDYSVGGDVSIENDGAKIFYAKFTIRMQDNGHLALEYADP